MTTVQQLYEAMQRIAPLELAESWDNPGLLVDLSLIHILDEANRCLGCKKPLCQEGCPIHTNIPEVIRLLKANQMDRCV